MYNDYLAHYGVKGMKWGVRKDRTPKGTRRGSSKKGSVGRRVASTVGGGIKIAAKGAASVPSRVKAANAEKHRQEAIEAIKKGDSETVKKNMKYLSSDDIHTTLDRMNAEKRLMSEIAANQKKTGAAAVGDALKNLGDSRMGRAAQKGAAEGVNKLAETFTKAAGTTAADAVGSGAAAAMTAYAMYKLNPQIGVPDLKKAFQSGVSSSVAKAAKEKYGLSTDAGINRQVFSGNDKSKSNNPSTESVKDHDRVSGSLSDLRKNWDNFQPAPRTGGVSSTPSSKTDKSGGTIDIATGKRTGDEPDPYSRAQAKADATRTVGMATDTVAKADSRSDRQASRPIDVSTGGSAKTSDPYRRAQESALKTVDAGRSQVESARAQAFDRAYNAALSEDGKRVLESSPEYKQIKKIRIL